MDRYSEVHSSEAAIDRNVSAHNRLLADTQDFSDSVLKKEDFAKTAKATFEFFDLDKSGSLDKDEIDRAFKMPLLSESKETMESIRIMRDKYEFLSHLGPSNEGALRGYYSITKADLDKAQDVLDGKIGNQPLSHFKRDWLQEMGLCVGGAFSATIGWHIGTSAAMTIAGSIGTGAALEVAAVGIGFASGLAVPVAVGMAVGYGIGYLYDKREAPKHQAADVSAFLKEFRN